MSGAGSDDLAEEVASLAADLAALAADRALLDPQRFGARYAALDALELLACWRLDALAAAAPAAAAVLLRRAAWLERRLRAADRRLFALLRAEIRAGLAGAALLSRLEGCLVGAPPAPAGYGPLDVLLGGVLHRRPPPETPPLPDPEMVAYQKTPAAVMLDLAAHLSPADQLVDLGAGQGDVALVVSLLSGARARGVELDAALCRRAAGAARALGVRRADIVRGDARAAELGDATAIYMYTPFTGALLDAVLSRIRGAAAGRRLRLFSYGPCTAALAREPWLRPLAPAHPDQLACFVVDVT